MNVRASSTQLAAAMAARLGTAAGDRLFPDEPMSAHTTFRIGGPADLLFSPACAEEIACAIHFCREHGIPVTLIGNGSNVLVSDRGIRGVVIALGTDFARITALDAPAGSTTQEIQTEAGARLASLAAFSARLGLSGLEALSGIPGSVGGALHMNAGAYDHSMQEVVVRTEYLDGEARTCTTEGEGHRFGYRRSLFMDRGFVVLRTTVRLTRDDPARISERIADYSARRRASQPLELPSAGSVFRRPPGHYAGRLVEECGMKGIALGGAQVSTKHAGFIVNREGATASDVRGLMERVQCTVEQRTGVHLEPEILLLGEW